MRVFRSKRNLRPSARERARIAGIVLREPVTVQVSRVTGNGISGPKVATIVSTFLARFDQVNSQQDMNIQNTDAYTLAPQGFLVTTTIGTDPNGAVVDIKRGDTVLINNYFYLVEEVLRIDQKIEARVIQRT